jgi:DNA-binding response OmpR family regulator
MSTELRVLVVDDEIDCAASLTALLRAHGCKTASGFGSATAVRIAELFKPNLVFLDLELPDTTGCELLSAIKGLSNAVENAVFVCLTGSSTEDAEKRCMDAGFDLFVRKPMRPHVLADILNAARVAAASQLESAATLPASRAPRQRHSQNTHSLE